jgi:PhnB protein
MPVHALIPHLHFAGEASRAIELYERALGAKTEARMTWAEIPGGKPPPGAADKIMHASLSIGRARVLIADRVEASPEVPAGNGTIMIEFDDPSEMDAPFAALAEGGKVVMAVHDAFWGARFGMVTDAFGVAWMFHCELKKG